MLLSSTARLRCEAVVAETGRWFANLSVPRTVQLPGPDGLHVDGMELANGMRAADIARLRGCFAQFAIFRLEA